MHNTPEATPAALRSPAAARLSAEATRIAAALASAERQRAAALDASAEPEPQASMPTREELERARLQDLADGGARLAELQGRADAARALAAAWRQRVEAARLSADRAGREADEHRTSLEEARALVLVAQSAAAQEAMPEAEVRYWDALGALRAAIVELAALQAISAAAHRARIRQGTPLAALSPVEVPAVVHLSVPGLRVVNAHGQRFMPGDTDRDNVGIADLSGLAEQAAHRILETMAEPEKNHED